MKLRPHEYCACIGFSGSKAIVSKQAARQYRGYSARQFADEGLLRQAFSLASYQCDEEQIERILQAVQTRFKGGGQGRSTPQSKSDLEKLFGYVAPPQQLSGIIYV
ncbi:MAG: hypothetical protein AAF975_05775 [Spirochaetota bacterium]